MDLEWLARTNWQEAVRLEKELIEGFSRSGDSRGPGNLVSTVGQPERRTHNRSGVERLECPTSGQGVCAFLNRHINCYLAW
jgi:hypothetical protein